MVVRGGKLGQVYNVGGHNERPNIVIVKTILEYVKENVDPAVGEHMMKHVADRKGHDRRYGIDPRRSKTTWAGIRKPPLRLASKRPSSGT